MLNYKKILDQEGTVVIPKEALPFSAEDWHTIENAFSTETFEVVGKGDTYELASVKAVRVKKPGDSNIYSKDVWEVLRKNNFPEFLKEELGMEVMCLDRLQLHHYQAGDFLAWHVDKESCQEYVYALLIHINDDYDGGNFCVKGKDGTIHKYKGPTGSLVITKCDLAHQVEPITAGNRKVIAGFIADVEIKQSAA